MLRVCRLATMLVLPIFVAACGADQSSQPPAQAAFGALTGPTISTALATYSLGAAIRVTYSGLPSNSRGYMVIAERFARV